MGRALQGADLHTLARERFGIETFRPGQEEAIRAVVSGRDTLAVLPTGHGKSAIYQLAAVLLPGPTVVISPLIALQRDHLCSWWMRRIASANGAMIFARTLCA